MEKLIDAVLHSSRHQEQSYNAVNGILHSCDDLPRYICEEAAKECVETGSTGYSYFRKTLNHHMNRETSSDHLPEHSNLRGKDFYK